MESVSFVALRQIVQSYTNLIGSTTDSGKGGGVVAMGMGFIASVGGSVHQDRASPDDCASGQQPETSFTYDDSRWPTDE